MEGGRDGVGRMGGGRRRLSPHYEVSVDCGDPPVFWRALPAAQELLGRGKPPGARREGHMGGVCERIELVQSFW